MFNNHYSQMHTNISFYIAVQGKLPQLINQGIIHKMKKRRIQQNRKPLKFKESLKIFGCEITIHQQREGVCYSSSVWLIFKSLSEND